MKGVYLLLVFTITFTLPNPVRHILADVDEVESQHVKFNYHTHLYNIRMVVGPW